MSQEQKIQKFFRTYFTEIKIKQDYAEKILKQAEQYQSKNRCKQFLARFFDALKKSFDGKNPKNFVTSVKRFLYIINKLLGESYKKENSGRYCELISSQIVPYYLFFFEIIFKHSLHELIVELKMQRMKWVKLITDGAFIKLRQGLYSMKRQQILSKHKFNLDRGFSQENLDKIKKIHQKRGLSEKQSNFYLGIENKEENRTENSHKTPQKSSQNSSDESDNEYQSSGKKRKYDTNFINDQNLPNSYYPSYDPNNVYNPNIYQNQFERPNNPQMLDPRFKRNTYNDQSPYVMNSAGRNFFSQEKSPNNFATLTNLRPSNYAPSLNPTPMTTYFPPPPIQKPQSYETPSYPRPSEFKEVKEPNGFNFNRQKIQKIRKELQKSLFKCKQCGLCFETGENYEKHTNQHFFERLQKETELELKTKSKKQSKLKLLDIKSWQSGDRSIEKTYRFEVLMSELSEAKFTGYNCFFCNQQLEISFSEKYEDWVFSDAIKINDQGKTSVMHFDCYECFKSDQNSPIST